MQPDYSKTYTHDTCDNDIYVLVSIQLAVYRLLKFSLYRMEFACKVNTDCNNVCNSPGLSDIMTLLNVPLCQRNIQRNLLKYVCPKNNLTCHW